MLEFKVAGLGIDTRSDHPVVILHSEGQGGLILPIWIGRVEAQSIAMALQNEHTERPLTHDLMVNIFHKTKCQVKRIEIHSVQSGTYYAHLFLEDHNGSLVLDARPSDCISLALRMDVPIFVSKTVQEQNCIQALLQEFKEAKDEDDKEAFLKFLENVKASDFKLPPNDKPESQNS